MVANEIRALREAVGLTQDDVCSRTGIARPNLSAYENGRRTPSPETLVRIRHCCRVRPSVALDANRDRVLAIARAHRGVDVEVFGSVARGEDRWDSDLDLLVTMEEGAGYFDLVRMKEALEAALDVSVDVVPRGGVTAARRSEAGDRILLESKRIVAADV